MASVQNFHIFVTDYKTYKITQSCILNYLLQHLHEIHSACMWILIHNFSYQGVQKSNFHNIPLTRHPSKVGKKTFELQFTIHMHPDTSNNA